MKSEGPGVVGFLRPLCAIQWCGQIGRVYKVGSPKTTVDTFDLDPFPENITEVVDRLEEKHNITIINFDREKKKILL